MLKELTCLSSVSDRNVSAAKCNYRGAVLAKEALSEHLLVGEP